MPDKPDRHERNCGVVRLPPEYKPLLRKIKRRTGQPMAWAVQIAVEHYARKLGIPFTPNWPEAT